MVWLFVVSVCRCRVWVCLRSGFVVASGLVLVSVVSIWLVASSVLMRFLVICSWVLASCCVWVVVNGMLVRFVSGSLCHSASAVASVFGLLLVLVVSWLKVIVLMLFGLIVSA